MAWTDEQSWSAKRRFAILHTVDHDSLLYTATRFAREGFEVVQVEEVERLGVTFERYRMEKELTDGV